MGLEEQIIKVKGEIGEVTGELKGVNKRLDVHDKSLTDLFGKMEDNKTEILTAVQQNGKHCEKEEVLGKLRKDVDIASTSAHGAGQAIMELNENVKPLLDDKKTENEIKTENRKELKRYIIDVLVLITFVALGYLINQFRIWMS